MIVLANLGGVADDIGEAVLPHVLGPVIARRRSLQHALELGAWDTVRTITTEQLTWSRHNRRARYFLGRALAETGHCDEADPNLRAAHAAAMAREYVAFYRAVCAAVAGEFDIAGEALQQAVDLGFLDGDRFDLAPLLTIPLLLVTAALAVVVFLALEFRKGWIQIRDIIDKSRKARARDR